MDQGKRTLRITIAGECGAGKTTTALKLKELLLAVGVTSVTIDDFDVNEGHEPANFQDKRWDAVKGNILFEVCTVQVQKKFATKKVASKEKTLARYVVQSPLTNNACHMISWPDEAGLVYINDLDMGEVHQVAFSDLVNAPMYREVEGDDFGFSWVAGSEHLSDDLYTWVMECIEDG